MSHRSVTALFSDPVGAAEFEPASAASHQIEQPCEVRRGKSILREHVTHVVDHEVASQCSEKIEKVPDQPAGSIELQMPATAKHAVGHSVDECLYLLQRQSATFEEIQAYRPHPEHMHPIELLLSNIRVDHYDATGDRACRGQCIEQTSVVRVVETRLHNDKALQPEHGHQPKIMLELTVRKCVVRPRDTWIPVQGPENMHVHIARTRGYLESRQLDPVEGTHGKRSQDAVSHRSESLLLSGCGFPA